MAHYVMLTLVYPPDTEAVGQLFADAAERLARRGHRVTVYAGECRDGMEKRSDGFVLEHLDWPSQESAESAPKFMPPKVVRLKWTNFGRKHLFARLIGQFSYLTQVFLRILCKRGIHGIVLTTIPPTLGIMYLGFRAFRKVPTLYWVMDVNPDRGVAMGHANEGSLSVKILDWANARLFCGSQSVVVLDRYMRQRVLRKRYIQDHQCGKVEIIPPWPQISHLNPVPRHQNTFLTAHHLESRRCIFMYSGYHNPLHPFGTLLAAIRQKRGRGDLAFLFVGDGPSKPAIEAFIEEQRPGNVRTLPWQPFERLSFSLSAPDVHIVIMGEEMVGIVHPCKIYAAMALAKPVLFIGPRQSHLGELVSLCGFGWVVEHGESDRLADLFDQIAGMPRDALEAMGAKGRKLIDTTYCPDALGERFCELVEGVVPSP